MKTSSTKFDPSLVNDGYPDIGDYGIIGDCRSAALVSKGGSLDWLCVPIFDGESFFGALLDAERGGRFVVRPRERFDSERRYLPDTNVLETTFTTDTGRVRLTDLMPAASEAQKLRELHPEHEVIRRIECLEGEVAVEVEFDPRPCYGSVVPRVVDRGPHGFFYENGREALVLRSEIPVGLEPGCTGACGEETLGAGEIRYVGFTYTDHDAAILPVFGDAAERKIERTVAWWRTWAGRCRYEGRYRDQVVRSALAVKLLTFAPSGAVVASPTTSLPEKIGGVRNWDYRYCWLRDASLTVQSLIDLGYRKEAEAFLAWMLHSTRRSWPELEVLYDVHGRRCPAERTLEHLEGYRGSSPVRVGNGARGQLQLDVYGEVADAVSEFVRRGGSLDRATRRLVSGLGETVCEKWRLPDESIWEIRSEPRHHTYSKAMCWVALDRLLRLHEEGHLDVPADRYRHVRDEIREAIETKGWNEEIGSYAETFGGDEVDASLLLLGRYGYADADSERMRKTCAVVHERLSENGLLYRYSHEDDGLPPGEGAFGIASFWAVDCRCRQGDLGSARQTFEHLLGFANDLGLYAEEIDPGSGAALGNFPQAFTHVGLIDAALTLAEFSGEEPARPTGRAAALEVEGT